MSKTTRADDKEPPRWAADLLASAHAGMALWRECKRKDCRRRQACADDVDQCGLRCAPKAWAWVQHAVAALAAGASRHAAMRAAEKAAPRGREVIVMRWPGGVFDDVVWLRKDDGSMERVDGPLPPAPWALQLRRLVGRRARWLRGECESLRCDEAGWLSCPGQARISARRAGTQGRHGVLRV